MAKVLAALQAFKNAVDLKLQNVILEGEALNMINSLNGNSSFEKWQSSAITNQGKALLSKQKDWKVIFASRKCKTYNFFGYFFPLQLLCHSLQV